MFRNQSTYPTVFLLLDTWHQTDYCIIVCGRWLLYSNSDVASPLIQDILNYARRGNDKDYMKVVGVFHAIRVVTLEVFKK